MPGWGQPTASPESPVTRATTGRPTASSTQVSGKSTLSRRSTRGMLRRHKGGQRQAQLCYQSFYIGKTEALTRSLFSSSSFWGTRHIPEKGSEVNISSSAGIFNKEAAVKTSPRCVNTAINCEKVNRTADRAKPYPEHILTPFWRQRCTTTYHVSPTASDCSCFKKQESSYLVNACVWNKCWEVF